MQMQREEPTELDLIEDECLKHSLRYEKDLSETSDCIIQTLLQSNSLRQTVFRARTNRSLEDSRKKTKKSRSKRLSECGKRTYLKSMSILQRGKKQQRHCHTKKTRDLRKRKVSGTRKEDAALLNEIDDAFIGDLPVTMSAESSKTLKDIARANTVHVDSTFNHLKPLHYESRQWFRKERYKRNALTTKQGIRPDTWRRRRGCKMDKELLTSKAERNDMWNMSRSISDTSFLVNSLTGELIRPIKEK